MGIMTKVFKEEPSDYTYHITGAAFLRVILMAAGAGLATWLLAFAFDRWLLTPVFCSGAAQNVSVCADTTALGGHIAAVLVGVMTVPLLTLTGVKRPLLVVIAAVAALWGMATFTGGSFVWSLVWAIATYALVYAALVWFNRIRGNVAAILFIVAFVILARVVLSL